MREGLTNPLARLNADDWVVLQEHAISASYRPGDVLLEEGVRSRALFVIREGTVRVEQVHHDQRITLAQMGPGDIFGEMGFVEDAVASASVVADDNVHVDLIEDAALQSLLASMPGFAIRFYHSLAIALAQRLRSTSRRLARAGIGEIAQINRYHTPRTGNVSPRQIPDDLSHDLATFEWRMRAVDTGLLDRSLTVEEAQRQVQAACNDLLDLLTRSTASLPLMEMGWEDLLAFRDPENLEAGVGDHVFRSTFPFLMLSATMARCYAKPRGFAEDFETTAMIYRNEPDGDGRLGPLVDRWFLERPLCHARRAGRDHLRGMLESLVGSWPAGEPVRVTCMASGTASELFSLLTSKEGTRVLATCIDLDEDGLIAAARQASRNHLGDRMIFLNGTALPGGDNGTSVRHQHIFYAYGFWEYLTDEEAIAFLDWSHTHLIDGGTVVVTNLEVGNPDRVLMEHVLDWKVNHRTVEGVRDIFAQSRFGTQEASAEVVHGQVVASCSKPAPLTS